MKKKILVIDDHPILREGIVHVLETEEGLEVCGQAGSAEEGLSLAGASDPDMVLTDLTLTGRSGLELIKDLAAIKPDLPVLVMSMHDEMIYAERVLRAGGRGYLMKESASDKLVEAINTVLAGRVFVSRAVTDHFLEGMAQGAPKFGLPLDRLTDRELEVFELIGHGKSTKEIATQLAISSRTVDAHRQHLREKFGSIGAGKLARYAIRWVESGALGQLGDHLRDEAREHC
jgi:DNA-binding NarL/FixJ family response regulator